MPAWYAPAMPRAPRAITPGVPHHITQRGNHGEPTFLAPGDYQQYLIWLGLYSRLHGLDVWAYCLMPNHVHIIAVPAAPQSIAGALRPLHMRYTQRVNAEHGWQGTLWQGRFYSCAMDEQHVWAAVRYVERNPVRAGLVERAEDYLWSSAQAHCGLRADPALSDAGPHPLSTRKWSGGVNAPDEATVADLIRQRTDRGRPKKGTQPFP